VQEDSLIAYDTAKLKSQWPDIVRSKLNAIEMLSRETYFNAKELRENDPPELWSYDVGRSPRPPDTTNPQADALAQQIRMYRPDFAGDPENYRKFRDWVGTPSLAETALALAKRFQNDAELAGHLANLLRLCFSVATATVSSENREFLRREPPNARARLGAWLRGQATPTAGPLYAKARRKCGALHIPVRLVCALLSRTQAGQLIFPDATKPAAGARSVIRGAF